MAYKLVPYKTVISAAVGDAFSALEELAGEMRGWYDNLTEGLQQTGTGQAVEQAADSLESVSEPDVPECLADVTVQYAEQVNRDKRRGPSRSVRCENACQMLNAVVQAAGGWLDENEELGQATTTRPRISAATTATPWRISSARSSRL